MSYSCVVTLELKEGVEADICVEFDCVHPGVPGDYWEPAEGPEFEITDVIVDVLYGSGWDKTHEELTEAGWYETIQKLARQAVDDYDELYEHQYDGYAYGDYCDT